MKRFLLTALLLFGPKWGFAAWFSGSGPDYSQGAGNTYYCASTGTVLTQAGVSVSSPALSLYNPFGSGKNLVVLETSVEPTASPAAAVQFSLAYNLTPSTGNLAGSGVTGTLTAALVGKSTSTATSASIARCTAFGILPALPLSFRYIGGMPGAAAISGVALIDNTQGKVVVPPGGMISIQSTTAANVLAHILFREDPQ